MALLDDLQHILSRRETKNSYQALLSALWLFERNPDLPLDEQAAGIALLVAAFLREPEGPIRSAYLDILYRISCTRPYRVGAQIDWQALTSALPQLPEGEIWLVLYLLRYAPDERYLTLLESYFDDFTFQHPYWTFSSWVMLAYTQRYGSDPQVLPFLREAENIIMKRVTDTRRQLQSQFHRVRLTRREYERHVPWFRTAQAWARQQFAEAEERIRQQVQLRPQGTSRSMAEENERRSHEPGYFPTRIQHWLTTPTSQETFYYLLRLRDTFEFETEGQYSCLSIDEVAQSVKVLLDYVLSAEDYVPSEKSQSVNEVIWQIIGLASYVHRYGGTYLDWQMLEDRLASLKGQEENPKALKQLNGILGLLSRSPNEHALEVLKPYLDHPKVRVRWNASGCIHHLLWHLSHYCAEVLPVLNEAEEAMKLLKQLPETPEKWQQIKACLEQLERDARPYFHFYSI